MTQETKRKTDDELCLCWIDQRGKTGKGVAQYIIACAKYEDMAA